MCGFGEPFRRRGASAEPDGEDDKRGNGPPRPAAGFGNVGTSAIPALCHRLPTGI
jgi:hypothetical protein